MLHVVLSTKNERNYLYNTEKNSAYLCTFIRYAIVVERFYSEKKTEETFRLIIN